jgi:hypothetical protein
VVRIILKEIYLLLSAAVFPENYNFLSLVIFSFSYGLDNRGTVEKRNQGSLFKDEPGEK